MKSGMSYANDVRTESSTPSKVSTSKAYPASTPSSKLSSSVSNTANLTSGSSISPQQKASSVVISKNTEGRYGVAKTGDEMLDRWDSLLIKYGNKEGVDPTFLKAVMERVS